MTKFSYVEALQVAEHSEATKSIAESVRAAVEGKNYVRSSGKIASSVALPENKSFVLLPNPATETTQIVLQAPPHHAAHRTPIRPKRTTATNHSYQWHHKQFLCCRPAFGHLPYPIG